METRTEVREKTLQKHKDSKEPVKIIMSNGFQMQGAVITDFDSSVIVADFNGVPQMLNLALVSTIAPLNRVPRQHWTNADWNSPARDFIRNN